MCDLTVTCIVNLTTPATGITLNESLKLPTQDAAWDHLPALSKGLSLVIRLKSKIQPEIPLPVVLQTSVNLSIRCFFSAPCSTHRRRQRILYERLSRSIFPYLG